MVKTLHFHCRGHRFDPWSGKTKIPYVVRCGQKKKKSSLKKKISEIQPVLGEPVPRINRCKADT